MEGLLPKSITIMGKKFKVKAFDKNVCGMMDYEGEVIYINPSVHTSGRQMIHTFWHEIFHALHYRLGLHQCLSNDVLEILAETQAELIVEFFYPAK